MPLQLKNIYFIFLLLTLSLFAKSQDATLSQPYHNLFFTNPAFAGTSNGYRINSFYRQQWVLLNSPFSQYGITYDQNISKYNSGVGISISNLVSGAIKEPSVNLAYSYRFKIKRNFIISLGIQGGFTQKYINLSNLLFPDQIENNTPTSENIAEGFNKMYADFGFGTVFFYKNFYGGLAAQHLNMPYTSSKNNAKSQLSIKISGQMAYAIKLKKRVRRQTHLLTPTLIFQLQDLQYYWTYGASMQYNYLIMGLFLRNDLSNLDALILSLGFEKKQIRFVYSYDMNIGKKATHMLGSHEVSITYLFNVKQKKKWKAVSCPTFLK